MSAFEIVGPGGSGDVELAYEEVTSGLSVTSSEGSPQDFIVFDSLVLDGSTRICVEIGVVAIVAGAGGAQIVVSLWQDSTDLGRMIQSGNDVIVDSAYARRYFTPAAGTYVFKLRAWRDVANGSILAGAGGAGTQMPAYGRITRV